MTAVNEIALAICLAGLAAVAYRWRATIRIWSWEERLGGCVVAAAALSLVLLAVHGVLGMVGMNWNAARLAPTFALVRGYRLYYPAESGPILDHVYGPVSALAFLPATIFR